MDLIQAKFRFCHPLSTVSGKFIIFVFVLFCVFVYVFVFVFCFCFVLFCFLGGFLIFISYWRCHVIRYNKKVYKLNVFIKKGVSSQWRIQKGNFTVAKFSSIQIKQSERSI